MTPEEFALHEDVFAASPHAFEAYQSALSEVLGDIENPQKTAAAVRKLQISITFLPSERRDEVALGVDVKVAKLGPYIGSAGKAYLDTDHNTGERKFAVENPRQRRLEFEDEPAPTPENNVRPMRSTDR